MSMRNTHLYRLLLLVSAIATFVLIVSGGIVRIAGSDQGCLDWPLCRGQWLPPLQLNAWIDYVHRLLTLVVGALIVALSLMTWKRQDQDVWVRRPPLIAMLLLILQVVVGAIIVRSNSPELIRMFHLGMAMLILGCLIVPYVALIVADETRARADGSTPRRGGRTMQRVRRYRRLVFGTALTAWMLALTSAGLEDGIVSSDTLPQLSGLSGALQLGHQGTLILVGLMLTAVSWSTWRFRRQDHVLLSAVGVAAGLLVVRAGMDIIVALPTSLPALLTGLHLALWSTLVVVGMLALRRPIPVMVEVPRSTAASPAQVQTRQPGLINDYISLTKPKVIMLLLVTTLAAMFITDGGMPSLSLVFWTMLGGYLAAGGAGAINCGFDEDIDIHMGRTSRRPVPSGRISRRNAIWFGLVLCGLSFVILATFTTMLAAVLAMIGAVYYALFYTRWLKRTTWQNIVIGGGAGSMPPLVGWAAVTGTLTLPAVVLFVIIFYWTPPHFWALALIKERDYARAGVPMLPVVGGEAETRWQIWLYSVLMFGITLLLTPLHAMGWIYLLLALATGIMFLRYAWNVWRKGEQAHVWGLYKYSLLYLALLFGAMVLDRVLLT